MMNKKLLILLISLPFLTSCNGGEPGYFFLLLFVVLPIVWFGYSLQKKVEENTDSLYIIEGQMKKLIDKIDELESKLSTGPKRTRTKKTTTDKK